MHCDNIIVMDKGRVAEQGTHAQLLGHRGIYYRMWTAQNSDNVESARGIEFRTNNESSSRSTGGRQDFNALVQVSLIPCLVCNVILCDLPTRPRLIVL